MAEQISVAAQRLLLSIDGVREISAHEIIPLAELVEAGLVTIADGHEGIVATRVPKADTKLTSSVPEGQDHREINPQTGQQKAYVVLTEEERAKGFVRPVRRSYIHTGVDPVWEDKAQFRISRLGKNGCGALTTMAVEIAETYARDPTFYDGTFCANCRRHSPLNEYTWADPPYEPVGS